MNNTDYQLHTVSFLTGRINKRIVVSCSLRRTLKSERVGLKKRMYNFAGTIDLNYQVN
jgi:hypothetical protein